MVSSGLSIILFLLAVAGPARAVTVAERIPTVPINGERFVSLQKWAAQNKFTLKWEQKEKSVEVSSRWTKMEFQVDSRKAEINGTVVWLSSSIPASRDSVYISQRDLETLIHPILYPLKGKRVRTVAIAPGHGGRDPGFTINKNYEKKYTLLLGKVVAEELRKAGLKVVMLRESDVYVSLEDQAERANKAKADIFLNLHYNAAPPVEAKGIETFCLTPVGATPTNGGREPSARSTGNRNDSANALLAYHVHRSMLQNMDMGDRGLKRAGFQVLREIQMPGILIEGGFMSNPFDARKIYDPRQRRKMASAIVDGVMAYKRLVERK